MFPQLFSFIVASCVRLGRQKPSINPLCHLNANFFLACFSITALQSHEEEVRVAEIHDFPLPLDGAVAVSLSSPYSLEATKVVSTTIDLFCPVFWSYFLFPLQIVAEPSNPTLFFLWNVSHNFCELFMWQRSAVVLVVACAYLWGLHIRQHRDKATRRRFADFGVALYFQ